MDSSAFHIPIVQLKLERIRPFGLSISQSELVSLGFPINTTAQDRRIVAQLTLGDDGLPRAISDTPLPLEVMEGEAMTTSIHQKHSLHALAAVLFFRRVTANGFGSQEAGPAFTCWRWARIALRHRSQLAAMSSPAFRTTGWSGLNRWDGLRGTG